MAQDWDNDAPFASYPGPMGEMALNLIALAQGSQPIRFSELRANSALVREIQQRLADLGLLDGAPDGDFGPVSRWATAQFSQRVNLPAAAEVTPALATALLNAQRATLFPAITGELSARRLVGAMRASGHYVVQVPGCLTIAYVEGMSPDGTVNGNAPNEFNDSRFLLTFQDDGAVRLVGAWEATTEPGRHYVDNPMTGAGAARIAFGQFKAWSIGRHRIGAPTEHEALIQTGPVRIHRDVNRDFRRTGDPVFVGSHFGINQHWGYDYPRSDIRNASAGCLVGRTRAGHREFMAALRSDPRFAASSSYRFSTSVLPATQAELDSHPVAR